jgi:hypothetical protein
MAERKWISFTDDSQEDSRPTIAIKKSSQALVSSTMADGGKRVSLTVSYNVNGVWQSSTGEFQQLEISGTSHVDEEGFPAVPKDGLFVALPDDASEVEVTLADKQMVPLQEEIYLAPMAQQFTEEEFQEVFEPDPDVYEQDSPYPGRDFDFIGLKTMDGVKVAHLIVFLGQYRPISKKMELVQSIQLEISYSTPPSDERVGGRKPRQQLSNDLILGLDLLDETVDFSERVEDIGPMSSSVPGETIEGETLGVSGISGLESGEEGHGEFPLEEGLTRDEGAESSDSPKIKIPGLLCEYLIITSSSLAPFVDPLRAAKANWPHYARIVITRDISNEFPASSLKESIKKMLQWAYKNWRIPPRFVVLAGDTDVIPMHFYDRSGKTYASDHYYQDILGDLVPEITVSRLPTSNGTQLRQISNYIARYPQLRKGDWGGWQKRVMLCAYQANTYETTCDSVANSIKYRYNVIKRYAKNTNKNQVISTLKQGVVIAVYRGHGSKTAWSSSNGLNSTDVRSLQNAGKPPFVLNICCQNGWIDDNSTETIAEAFIRHCKAVAEFASSRNSWTYPNNDYIKYMFDAVMIGGCNTPAAIIKYAKIKMVRNHPTSSYHHDNTVMYNLFGDPTAHVASNAEFLRGSWDMNHDGWQGSLNVTRIWNYRIASRGRERAPVWSISGQYVARGKSYPFAGELGGFDSNQLGSNAKRTDYRFDFKIKFSPSNNQRFLTYLHTWNPLLYSGMTWWANHPFGVQGKKR